MKRALKIVGGVLGVVLVGIGGFVLYAAFDNASQFVPGSQMPTWNGIIAENEYAPLIAYVHEIENKAGKR
jgi:hypothetical protein